VPPEGPPLAEIGAPSVASLPAWALSDAMRAAHPDSTIQVDRAALARFAAAALRAAGARPGDARATAETLLLADARGHASHGLSRLRQYLRLCDAGSIDPRARHEVLVRRPSMESWHAHHALGPAVGHRAMGRAISMARRTGLAAVHVRDAGHYGIAGAYVLQAMESGFIGISSCNAEPRVPPTGAAGAGMGTNPIAIGAPDGEGGGFLLDMATSVVALGKVEIRKRAHAAIPAGWGLDVNGRPTTDADAILSGMMLPLGGLAETSGYKGYGLAAAVELLTGLLGGGAYGLSVTGLWDTGKPSSVSQLHLALDLGTFGAEQFQHRLRAWRSDLTSLPRQPGVSEILVAGDPEWRSAARQAERLPVLVSTLTDLAGVAVERGLRSAWRAVTKAPGPG
jgi:LDH2 family malate/lactate/ureidoglycolate dehydrogenase